MRGYNRDEDMKGKLAITLIIVGVVMIVMGLERLFDSLFG